MTEKHKKVKNSPVFPDYTTTRSKDWTGSLALVLKSMLHAERVIGVARILISLATDSTLGKPVLFKVQ